MPQYSIYIYKGSNFEVYAQKSNFTRIRGFSKFSGISGFWDSPPHFLKTPEILEFGGEGQNVGFWGFWGISAKMAKTPKNPKTPHFDPPPKTQDPETIFCPDGRTEIAKSPPGGGGLISL